MRIIMKNLRIIGIALLLAGFMVIYSAADDTSRFVSGTSVNGIGVGGLTVEEAKSQIEGFYAGSYKLSIIKKGGTKEYISGSDISYQITVPDGLSGILEEQNNTGRRSGPSVDNAHRMEMLAVFNQDALVNQINKLSCVSGSDIKTTQNASITPYEEGKLFRIIPEVYGTNLDYEKTCQVIKTVVSQGKTEVNLAESGCYYEVSITSENENLNQLCSVMNQCKDMTITYVFGEFTEELDGQTITTWITGVENGQIGVNREAAAAHVKSLADKYNSAHSPRLFQTTSGRTVTVSGALGWVIDQGAETDALIGMIRTGQTQSREPAYSQRAHARTGGDWGNTYVEIDLTGQHVYMYQGGTLVWDAPCVTGNVAKGYTTPAGIYTLSYKETNRILRGKKLPNGKYEYESHVDYWMPFNGGIGLHDAKWRRNFGGTIYKNNGSHGCINLPPAKAKILYGLVYKGIPVICYN